MIDCRRLMFGYLYILMAAVCIATVLQGRAAASPIFVMLEYDDETIYKDIDSDEIMSSIVLEKMVDKGFVFVEGQASPEEAQLIGDTQDVPDELDMDFGYFLQTGSDVAGVRLCNAKEGDILDVELTKAIGQRYGADYLVYGTVNALGTMSDSDGGQLFGISYNLSESGLYAMLTLRIVEAATGKVIFMSKESASAKNQALATGVLKLGQDKVNTNMYYGAMEKTVDKLIKKVSERKW